MNNPTNTQHREMLDVLAKAHSWIDTMQIAGLEEGVIVPAIHTALVERYLRVGGVSATVDWLQRQADMALHLGPAMLSGVKKRLQEKECEFTSR
jgi:hypothetical protein